MRLPAAASDTRTRFVAFLINARVALYTAICYSGKCVHNALFAPRAVVRVVQDALLFDIILRIYHQDVEILFTAVANVAVQIIVLLRLAHAEVVAVLVQVGLWRCG